MVILKLKLYYSKFIYFTIYFTIYLYLYFVSISGKKLQFNFSLKIFKAYFNSYLFFKWNRPLEMGTILQKIQAH